MTAHVRNAPEPATGIGHDRAAPGGAGRLPGVDGFWALVIGDLALFTALFVGFVWVRAADPDAAEQARLTLDADRGGINTLVLLTASWCVVQGVRAARDRRPSASRWMLGGVVGGALFTVVKLSEYVQSASTTHDASQADFFTWYYAITGLHLVHVVVATGFLAALAVRWRRQGPSAGDGVDSVAIYWHLVDALWIVIFPLIYLARA